jgi:hypothetical protein
MIQYTRALKAVFNKKFDHNEFERKETYSYSKLSNGRSNLNLFGFWYPAWGWWFFQHLFWISVTKLKMIIEHLLTLGFSSRVWPFAWSCVGYPWQSQKRSLNICSRVCLEGSGLVHLVHDVLVSCHPGHDPVLDIRDKVKILGNICQCSRDCFDSESVSVYSETLSVFKLDTIRDKVKNDHWTFTHVS